MDLIISEKVFLKTLGKNIQRTSEHVVISELSLSCYFPPSSILFPSITNLDAELTISSLYKITTLTIFYFFFFSFVVFCGDRKGTSGGNQKTETIKSTQGANINILNRN